MHCTDSRGADLHDFDRVARELSHHYDVRFQVGGSLASRDIERLSALAERLGRDVEAWRGAIDELEAGATGLMEPCRAGRLLIESVFDEALIPEATRVLAAALALVFPAP